MCYNALEGGDDVNTIVINKILVHMIDFEHRKIHLSDEFATLNDTTQDYYQKKVEKGLNSNQIKQVVVGSMHEMMLRANQMIENDKKFKEQAKEVTEKFFKLGSVIEGMPNCMVLHVDCYKDGDRVVAALKLNYKFVPVSVLDPDNVRISRAQTLPGIGAPVDEAIIVNVDRHSLYLIEKKYAIDGKLDTYLNTQWIKGEEKLTDRQKVSAMTKVVKKAEANYSVKDSQAIALMKQQLNQKVMHQEVIKPIEIVQQVLASNDQAAEESKENLKNLGVDSEDTINANTLTSAIEKCKITTDTDMSVTVSVEDYVNKNNIEIRENTDGTSDIILSHINEINVR